MNVGFKTKPFFSVIIPLYNREDLILRSLESVLNQDFQDFEIIIVDDGSSDDSAGVAERVLDKRGRLIRQENQGGAGAMARNTGMKVAYGSWFAFIDADDFWHPNHLSELRKIISKFPEVGLVSTNIVEMAEGVYFESNYDSGIKVQRTSYFNAATDDISAVHSSSSAIRCDVPGVAGYFKKFHSGPDLEYWARVSIYFSFGHSTRPTAIYFRGNGGNMEKIAETREDNNGLCLRLKQSGIGAISPSVGFLLNVISDHPNLRGRKDIEGYINARIDQTIRFAVVNQNFKALRLLADKKFRPQSPRSLMLSLISRQPILFVLPSIEFSRKMFKRLAVQKNCLTYSIL